ncbi:MAG TPA: hypothetical protein VGQ85_06415, partial [Candidatus Limnocylindrales bacterium]|nr:hypothetical protein [Candidatus Limnocylindrales bacterium]
ITDRREITMYQATTDVDYRITELYQVAADLRAARVSRPETAHRPNRIRVAIGRAFLGVGFALAPGSGQRNVPTA